MISKAKYREDKQNALEPTVDHLKNVYSQLDGLYITVRDKISEFTSSEHNPTNIARIITENKPDKLSSLALIHKSMYRIQSISNDLMTSFIPESSELFNNVDILVKTVEKEIIFDSTFERVTTSNAEKDREKDFICLYVNNEFLKIKNKYKDIKLMFDFVNDLISYLNKLDSMVRLQEKIESNLNYGEMVTNNTPEQVNMSKY